jgi:hypothetical protein
MCLFADLSLLSAAVAAQSIDPDHMETRRAGFWPCAEFPRECSNVLRFLIAIAKATP